MLRRLSIRSFKSWHQYQKEKQVHCLSKYVKPTEQKLGGFELWKREVSTAKKINFLLDHCSEEERARYLKEFSTEELALYLKNNVSNLSEDQLDKIWESKRAFHALPVFNSMFKMFSGYRIKYYMDRCKTERQRLEIMAIESLKDKLKELEWRQIDKKTIDKVGVSTKRLKEESQATSLEN